ncbi:ER membrane protein complex subunit 2-like [Schistocerca americana]|uniref:ER membrane protein complex subunit 2-like n=1 Tax=Schistocerca americana TaxID=7009 RepID=UPI001F4F80E9|nr:ER membrane protein complex subunit 2-like [Schistocerca americana]XP_047110801.1 ER membrane protein complex subunit 2-like isoform X1 [Schistocerca piceifrons]XP_049773967.1 ER membrane protein complex subunit 2-like [Schistocerca cancellata]XP_049813130.1 ER membrane protein complex subunit 2-like [Schistocerca nitens]XP_049863079.1 ER membrane protein complex subunit 2-like isoform X2 [Schistocerca gregaria]XP_049959526.1 ER membrane protein complex subunit 2-like [Schistocerca serialis
MSWNSGKLSWSEVRDLFRKWREENERNSREIVDLWETVLMKKVHKLGDERLLVLEQVCVAALDCNRLDVADRCVHTLSTEFPTSLRVRRLRVLQLEAMERYDEALELLDSIIKRDETNAAPRKRRVAIFKARGKIPEAIKELTDYLKKFMSDQEGWQELCELYLMEQDLARAAFCMEELLLHNPHSHLIHQRYAEIKYTQGGFENMELARAHYCEAIKLNPNNMRALYGLFLAATNIGLSPKCTSTKKKEAQKLAKWALHEIALRYERQSRNKKQVASLESLVSSLQISGTS